MREQGSGKIGNREQGTGVRGQGAAAIEAEQLTKKFISRLRGREVTTLREVSLRVGQGEIFGFLGPNGAGKTTFIKLCLGFIFPSKGKVRLFGKKVTIREVKARVGFLPERPYFPSQWKAGELLRYCGRLSGLTSGKLRRKTDELFHLVGLERETNKRLGHFSKGMLQRLGLAQALVGDPDLLILDEPTIGLDPVMRRKMRDILIELNKGGKTIFMSSHEISEIEMVCHRVGIINKGKLLLDRSLSDLVKEGIIEEPQLPERSGKSLEDIFLQLMEKENIYPSGEERGCANIS